VAENVVLPRWGLTALLQIPIALFEGPLRDGGKGRKERKRKVRKGTEENGPSPRPLPK